MFYFVVPFVIVVTKWAPSIDAWTLWDKPIHRSHRTAVLR